MIPNVEFNRSEDLKTLALLKAILIAANISNGSWCSRLWIQFGTVRKSMPKPSRATRHANFILSPLARGWGGTQSSKGPLRELLRYLLWGLSRKIWQGIMCYVNHCQFNHRSSLFLCYLELTTPKTTKNTVRNISSSYSMKRLFNFGQLCKKGSPSLKNVCVCWRTLLPPRFFVPNTDWKRPKVNQSIYFDPILGKLKHLLSP